MCSESDRAGTTGSSPATRPFAPWGRSLSRAPGGCPATGDWSRGSVQEGRGETRSAQGLLQTERGSYPDSALLEGNAKQRVNGFSPCSGRTSRAFGTAAVDRPRFCPTPEKAVGIDLAPRNGVKKLLWGTLIALGLLGAGWQSLRWSAARLDAQRARFVEDAGNLLLALQQYKEFTGHYPTGQNLDIARALTGQGPEKIVILTVRKNERNAKGELVDPWGTPLAFYFAGNSVLIRSAGPNRVWEDSASRASDDLFRSN